MISRLRVRKTRRLTLCGFVLGSVVAAVVVAPITSAKESASSPIVVGIADAKSGFMSQFDGPVLAGARLAVADFNAKGGVLGRQLKIIHCDTKSDKALAGQCATQLLSKGANFIIPSCDFDYGGPSAIQAQARKVVAIGCVGSTKFGVQGIGRYAFNLINPSLVEANNAADWAYRQKRFRTVYILQDTNLSYAQGLIDEFRKEFTRLAGPKSVVGRDTFLQTDPSIASQVSRIANLSKEPDFILMISNPPGGASALRQIRAAGIKVPIISDTGMSDDFWLSAVPGLSNFFNLTYACTHGDDPRPEVNRFYKRFSATAPSYARKSAKFGVGGYAMIQVVAEAVKRAKSTNSTALRNAMERFTNFPTMMQPITWSPKHHFPLWRAMSWTEAVNGKSKCAGFSKADRPVKTSLG